MDEPEEALVMFEHGGNLLGYGGLVNIDWTSLRGEVSYLAATDRARDLTVYVADFARFLRWVEVFAFADLHLKRIHTETWEFRTTHLQVLEEHGFQLEGRLRRHIIKDGVAHDALLHGLLSTDRF